MFLRHSLAVLVCTFAVSACMPSGIFEGSTCCACLLNYGPDGAPNSTGDSGEPSGNCIPGSGDFNEENAQCSTQVSESVNGAGTAIEVTDLACVESACEAECADAVELGMVFEVPGD